MTTNINLEPLNVFAREHGLVPEDETNPRGLPTIQIPGDNRLISEFADELGKRVANDGLYQAHGNVVRVDHTEQKLEVVNSRWLQSWIESCIVPYKVSARTPAGLTIKRSISDDVARSVLSAPQFLERLPAIDRVNPCPMPVMRANRSIELLPVGMDHEAKVYTIDPGFSIEAHLPLCDATACLDDLLREVAWADDGGIGRSVQLAAMLSVFAACLLPPGTNRPIILYLANAEGAGKTLLAQLATIPYPVATADPAPAKEEEWQKKLLALVLARRSVLLIDNVKSFMNSPSLEAYATTPTFCGRILGESREVCGPSDAMLLMTGNGMTISPDLRRRSLTVELFTPFLRSEDRQFSRMLDAYTIADLRPQILSALWTLVREWCAAGQPSGSIINASFPRWCQTIAGIVEFAGYGSPLRTVAIEGMGDVDSADIAALGDVMVPEQPYAFSEVASLCEEHGLFERFTSDKDGDGGMRMKTRASFSKLLVKYRGRRIAPAGVFEVTGKGHARRYVLAPTRPHPDPRRTETALTILPSGPDAPSTVPGEAEAATTASLPDAASATTGLQSAAAPTSWTMHTSGEALATMAEEIRSAGSVALDIETWGDGRDDALNPWRGDIRLLSLRVEGRQPWILDLGEIGYDLGPISDVLADVEVIAHNAEFDLLWLLQKCGIHISRVFCTMTASRLLNAGTSEKNGLDVVLSRQLGVTLGEDHSTSDWGGTTLTDEQLYYAARDVVYLHLLAEKLKSEVYNAGLNDVAALEMTLLPIVVGMESRGFAVDIPRLIEIKNEAEMRMKACEESVRTALVTPLLNISSPIQLRGALTKAGLKLESTNEETLREHIDHTGVRQILEYRGHQKLAQQASQYMAALEEDGRVHARFNPTGTDTGRFTCSSPNLQNVARGPLRECFIAPSGRVLVVADYSQIELRAAAAIAGEPKMLEAYTRGDDLHKITAAAVLSKGGHEVSREDRQLAKAVNFGLLYGQRSRGMMDYARTTCGVNLTEEQAAQLRRRFFDTYPSLEKWHRLADRQAGQHIAESRSVLGRRRIIPGKASQWQAFTTLVNTPVQGACADGMKLALLALSEKLPEDTHLISTIHDEVIVEAPEAAAELVLQIVRETMVTSMQALFPSVPIEVEAQICSNWGEK